MINLFIFSIFYTFSPPPVQLPTSGVSAPGWNQGKRGGEAWEGVPQTVFEFP